MGRTITQVKLQLITCQGFQLCVFFNSNTVLGLHLESSRHLLARDYTDVLSAEAKVFSVSYID
jgi:hypothetical protein